LLLVAAGISLVQADTPEMRAIAKQNRDKVLYCVIDTVSPAERQQQLQQYSCETLLKKHTQAPEVSNNTIFVYLS
jgi:hypothetical protein